MFCLQDVKTLPLFEIISQEVVWLMALVAGLAGWAGLISATAGGQMSGSSLIREPVHVSGALDARGMACRIAMLAFRGATRYSAKQC